MAKLIVHAASRPEAIARAHAALRRFVVLGLKTNIAYLQAVTGHHAFMAGDVDTTWLDRHHGELIEPDEPAVPEAAAAAAHAMRSGPTGQLPAGQAVSDPWQALDRWRAAEP